MKLQLAVIAILIYSFVAFDNAFAESAKFSIDLPENWIQRPGIQYAYANQDVSGNYILVNSVATPKTFGVRDDFHGFIKSTEYTKAGFGLGKGITTVDTDYGFKSTIEFRIPKFDGSVMTLRKDYHYDTDERTIFQLHGYSSDLSTKAELKRTLDTFRPA